ncbi:MAG TPA: 2-C-methyl-D-erythritol 4-phosphate cytidylyltransferase [Candidatus Didemnitutus sp.]|nr:2-C-methyl-D-erythritol 4-phosphate cytidylyltransferase [Candidatus Didemnitutus sp.]
MTNERTSRGVIIPAAGRGTRFGGATPKQFLELLGVPLLVRCIRIALQTQNVNAVVVAIHPDDEVVVSEIFVRFDLADARLHVVRGSTERQHSVRAALAHPSLTHVGIILVHDAVRPLSSPELWETVASSSLEKQAVVPVIPIADTLKSVDHHGRVRGTVDRSTLFRVQTPQGFASSLFRRAYDDAEASGRVGTDCASLVEQLGSPVHTVPGEETNFKVTTPYDLDVAEFILQKL